MKKLNEHDFYEQIKDWSFDEFKIETEEFTNWDMYEILKNSTNEESKVLDLGTGGGEKVLEFYPTYLKEVIGIDFSKGMIETANKNLEKSGRKNISFKFMNNLKLDFEDEYFDVVVARNTVTNPEEIYRVLKPNGKLIIHGVDMFDCHELKLIFGKGQGFNDKIPISIIDFNAIFKAGFNNIELVPLHEREYFKNEDLFYKFLLKVPIIENFSEETEDENAKEKSDFYKKELDRDLLSKYIKRNTFEKGIRLIRRYYGITATKS